MEVSLWRYIIAVIYITVAFVTRMIIMCSYNFYCKTQYLDVFCSKFCVVICHVTKFRRYTHLKRLHCICYPSHCLNSISPWLPNQCKKWDVKHDVTRKRHLSECKNFLCHICMEFNVTKMEKCCQNTFLLIYTTRL